MTVFEILIPALIMGISIVSCMKTSAEVRKTESINSYGKKLKRSNK